MFSLGRILLPVDFSDRSQSAARYAQSLARRFGTELVLIHVLSPPHYELATIEAGGTLLDDLFTARIEHARKQLDGFLASELAGAAVERRLREGDAARQIIETARACHADLILMSTHGYGTFRRFILGSVTAKVLHDALCPVWTGVHIESAPQVEMLELRRIVVAVDLGPQSPQAIAWGLQIASACQARLVIVHALPCAGRTPGAGPIDPAWRQQVTAEIEQRIHALGAPDGVEIALEPGDAPDAVCRYARSVGADLLVIARGSAAGSFGRLRTNAYAIIRESPCPVVSV